MMAEIRCRTRFAVVERECHNGVKHAITSALVTCSTDVEPMLGNTYVARDDLHWFSDLPPGFHLGACNAITRSAGLAERRHLGSFHRRVPALPCYGAVFKGG